MKENLLRFAMFSCFCIAAPAIFSACAGTLTITSPANGATVSSPVTVAARVDSTTCNTGFNHLQVLVNGTLTYQGTGSCSISAPVAVPQGSDALNVQAIAWNGSLMAQSTVTVTFGSSGNG